MRLQIVLLGLAMSCDGAHRDRGPAGDESFVPSNAATFGDFGSDDLTVAPPDGAFDTDHDCTPTSALGACTALTDACVCRANTISIGTLHVTGSRMLVLLAARELTVGTLLDASGHGSTPGPGAIAGYSGSAADALTNAAGGSFATPGAADRSGSDSIGATYGDPSLVPLAGGMIGQDGTGGSGGGGGGGVQLSAGEQLEIDGAIEVDGGGAAGGTGSWASSGGGGGGAGGAVLLEGASVVVDGRVRTNGGGGGGGGGTAGIGEAGDDGDGSNASTTSRGGNGAGQYGCALYGYIGGGFGGDGATGSGSATWAGGGGSIAGCIDGPDYAGAGGGGGGVGRIRVNSATGCDCSATFSPAPTFGTVEAR